MQVEKIKERIIKLKSSDEDCDRIIKKAGICNLTVEEFLENFILDLVGGTQSSGSNEREFVNRWF
ncbi:hypothetical protein [Eubacterium aggregans]|uniref:hypothetical protein n=1 Tax=Eubacterium aggregans TaxID=81409 RepID=UPI003F39ACF3